MMETAIAAAMRKAGGLEHRDGRLMRALTEFQNHGGTEDKAHELVRAAYALLGEGHRNLAENGQSERANVQQPNGDRPSPPFADGGHCRSADSGPPHGASVRALPGHAKRKPGIPEVQASIARSIFDTFRVPDGRPIGDVQWHELRKIAGASLKTYRVVSMIEMHVANAEPFAKVREVVKESVVEEAIRYAEKLND